MTVLRDRSQSSISEEDIRPWNTYGSFNTNSRSFSSHDGTSAAIPSAVAPDARAHRHDPYAVASQPYRREAVNIKWGVSHQPLIGSCFYIPFPKIRAVTHSTTTPLPEGAVQLQIRQVRFETETGQIRWLVRRLTGVHVIKAEKMVPGVLHIWVRSTQDADRICNILHHNILFDFQGVFAPLNIEQKQAVMAYIETRQFHTRSQRLPREPMTVTRMYAPPPPPPPPAFALASAPTSPLL